MKDYKREKLTLDQAMKCFDAKFISEPYIVFDPKVDYQYRIIRRHAHDGLWMFTDQLLLDCLMLLLQRQSYYKPMGPPDRSREAPFYTIGYIRRAVVYGDVDLPCGRVMGCRESWTIPVKCEYRAIEV